MATQVATDNNPCILQYFVAYGNDGADINEIRDAAAAALKSLNERDDVLYVGLLQSPDGRPVGPQDAT